MFIRLKIYFCIIISIILFLSLFNSSYAFNQELINDNAPPNIFEENIYLNAINNETKYSILYPLSTFPALVEKNSNFTIKFKADEFDIINVIISTSFEPVIDVFILENINLWEENSIWNIEVYISNSIPEELYNITLLFEVGDKSYKYSQPRSLNIYNKFSDDFNFVHIADIHFGDPRGLVESISETIGFKSIKRCISEVNLLHPDFVIISGDIVFGQLFPFEYINEYKKCYELLQMFDVPIFLIPGNHDGYNRITEDGFDYWEKYFGPLYYSFDFGNYHFTGVNTYDMSKLERLTFLFIPLNWGGSITDHQLQWIKNDLESSNADLNFMFLHHNPLWDTKKDSLIGKGYENRENILSLIYDNDVDMVLAGHNHLDTVNIENDVIFITTTTPESEIRNSDGYWGYRLIEIRNGEISSYNYKDPKYSIPSYQIDYNLNVSNNKALATINNNLDIDINITLRILLDKGFYNVDNGEIKLQRDSEKYSELYIYSNIQAHAEELVILSENN